MIQQLTNRAHDLRRRMGVDGAIAYTFAARACGIIGSTGTVLLIVRFLSKVEQGYYYTLFSLVNLQVIFELGFSFVILQLAAHEAVHLTFHLDGGIGGDPVARARLVAILHKTLRWYSVASILMLVTLLPAGIAFFHRNSRGGDSAVWLGPWLAAGLAMVMLFSLNPFISFLEGCGQVRQVAQMRLGQAIMTVVLSWGALVFHRGLYAPAGVVVASVLVALGFVVSRRALLYGLLRTRPEADVLSWRQEVWTFQWKIAVTWISSYFALQILIPIVFAARGAVEAGRLGMSLSIAGYMWNLVFAWMSTKATPFGQLVAKRDYQGLDRLFFRTLWQSLAALGCIVATCMALVMALQRLAPSIASRMVSPTAFALLLLAAVGTFVIQCEAIYLRAHKEEPLVWQSLTVALLTCVGAWFVASRWGAAGVSLVYFVCSGVVGVISATIIFQFKRNSRVPVLVAVRELPYEVVQ